MTKGVFIGTSDTLGRHVYKKEESILDTLAVPGRPPTVDDESGLFEWGTRNNRAFLLGQAILEDVMGKGHVPKEMVHDFVEEMISKLPTSDFRLFECDVLIWKDNWKEKH